MLCNAFNTGFIVRNEFRSCALEIHLTVGATPVLYIPIPGGYPRGFLRILGISTKAQTLISVLLMHCKSCICLVTYIFVIKSVPCLVVATYTAVLFYFRFELILPDGHRLKPPPWMRNIAILIIHIVFCSGIVYTYLVTSLEDRLLKQRFHLASLYYYLFTTGYANFEFQQYNILPASFDNNETMLINCDITPCVEIAWFYGLSMAFAITLVVVLIYHTYRYLHSYLPICQPILFNFRNFSYLH